jgi:catechol 2,3-dioxygenase-like lactoylglutathione lyase family enzyme
MKFSGTILAVSDMEASKRFYAGLFGLKIGVDLGENVFFTDGFALQHDYARLVGFNPDTVKNKSHNFELYFEEENFDAFLKKLEKRKDIDYVHRMKKYPWQQRVVRIYDPDKHIIEIGESMASIVRRYLAEGKTIEEIADIIQHPAAVVQAMAENKL